jgi:dihydroorotase
MTVIQNARLVNEGRVRTADLRFDGERIEQVGGILDPHAGEDVIDANGAWLLPGLIDDQVHFREPGFEHKACIETESRAAVAGGVTTYFEMPNTSPQTIDEEALRWKRERAAATSTANFAFYLGATNDNLEAIKSLDPALACGVKVFMGASTGNMLVDDPETLEAVFAATPLVVATHCEDTPTIEAALAEARETLGDDVPVHMHPVLRSHDACLKSSTLAVELARRHGTRLHVLHLTTAQEMALFDPGPVEKKRITAEACVHHLFFDSSWYATLGNRLKCNPAVKHAEDRQALLQALRDDRIDIIATDHAPHLLDEKALPYLQAPAGLPLVQHKLPVLLELVAQGELRIEDVVRKACHNPARRFEVAERGFLREGYYADLVLADPNALTERGTAPLASRCGWSPFEDLALRGRVLCTWVNGQLVYDRGSWPDAPRGRAVEFNRKR